MDSLKQHNYLRQQWAEVNARHSFRLRSRNSYFHKLVNRLLKSQVPAQNRVIDVGCSDGSGLSSLNVAYGAGIDLDYQAIDSATRKFPHLHFVAAPIEEISEIPLEVPDYVVMSFILDEVYDVQRVLEQVASWCTISTRVVIASYSRVWRPALRLAEILRLKSRPQGENYVPWQQLENILELAGLERTKRVDGIIVPIYIPLLSNFMNRWLAPLPIIRSLCLVRITVARRRARSPRLPRSVSIVVPARNEQGNIREILSRVPKLAEEQEIIFVEGHSTDSTWDEIQRAIAIQPDSRRMNMRAIQQTGTGKGNAVREGFDLSIGEVLIILDADLSVPPEELVYFVEALSSDSCEFANGTRLVYPRDDDAMRFLNLIGNRFFGQLFSFLLGQPVTDTLCGTKVLWRDDYLRLQERRSIFGNFDPFGDFDLLFGASYGCLRIRDIPVHYKARKYGQTNISRFSDGLLLLRMSAVASRKLKFIG